MRKEAPLFSISEDERCSFAQKLLIKPLISAEENVDTIEAAPYPQELGVEFGLKIAKKINKAEKARENVEDLIVYALCYQLFANTPDVSCLPTANELIDTLINYRNKNKIEEAFGSLRKLIELSEHISAELPVDKNTYEIVLSHFGVYFAGSIYKKSQDEDIKKMSKTFVVHFAALSAVFLGAKSNASLFAFYPDRMSLESVREPRFAINLEDRQAVNNLRMGFLFDGDGVSNIENLDGDLELFINHPKEGR